jgi:hypothetical protein
MVDIFGGSYGQCKGKGGEGHHVYYWAAYKEVLGITRDDGPAIHMEKQDHRKLLSSGGGPGSSNEAQRLEQRSLLEQGKYKEAWNFAIQEIRNTPNIEKGKYDLAIAQAEGQLLKLDTEKKIQLDSNFKLELQSRQQLRSTIEQHLQQGKTQAAAQKQAELQAAYDKVCSQSNKDQVHQPTKTPTAQPNNQRTVEEKMNASIKQGKQPPLQTSINKPISRPYSQPQQRNNQHQNLSIEQKMNLSTGKSQNFSKQDQSSKTVNTLSDTSKNQPDKNKRHTHQLGL